MEKRIDCEAEEEDRRKRSLADVPPRLPSLGSRFGRNLREPILLEQENTDYQGYRFRGKRINYEAEEEDRHLRSLADVHLGLPTLGSRFERNLRISSLGVGRIFRDFRDFVSIITISLQSLTPNSM